MELSVAIVEKICRTQLPKYNAWRDAGDYRFDVQAALRACEFIQECLCLTTGRWMGQPYDMLPWHVSIVGNLFGWHHKVTGLRRYRRVLVTTARKSAKSHVAAAIALLHFFCDSELNPSITIAAGNAEQAKIIYDIIRKMIENESELSSRCEIMARAIRHLENGGSIRFVNSASGTKHGSNESCVIIDELHVITDPELVDVLETATRSRQQPIVLFTTTAGNDPSALWAETFEYADKVRSGAIVDLEYLPCMWQADPTDDIKLPATWRKAQPSLGVSVSEAEYARDLKKALASPRYLPVFKQLSLNLPSETAVAWLDFEKWKKCAGTVNPPEHATCFGGCDLASVNDTSAFVLAFPQADGRVMLLPYIYLPEDNVDGLFKRSKRDKSPYRVWANNKHILTTAGNVIDFEYISDHIIELSKKYDIKEIQMDPHAASSIASKLQAAGVNVQYVRQGWTLSEAAKRLEMLVDSQKIIHPNNPAYNSQIASAIVHVDRRENLTLDKAKSNKRIDSVMASVMALNSMINNDSQPVESDVITEAPELIFM